MQAEDWCGSIILPCTMVYGNNVDVISTANPDPIDVCEYLNRNKCANRLQFCNQELPPPQDGDDGFKGGTWNKLVTSTQRAAHVCGLPVIAASGNKRGHKFICQLCNDTNKKKSHHVKTYSLGNHH